MIERHAIYRWLLYAYPRPFRREFGDDIVRDLEGLRHEGHRGRVFWTLVLRDVATSAAREQVDVWTSGMRALALRWVCGCTVATAATGVAIWLFVMLVNVIFPPRVYPTGVVHSVGTNLPFGVYGAVIGCVIGGGQAWALRAHIRPAVWVIVTAVAAALGMSAGTSAWVLEPRWPLGYFVGVAVLGAIVGTIQCLLLKPGRRAAVDWIAWTTAATVLAIATVSEGNTLLEAASWPLRGLLAFFAFPAVIGLVMGALTVRPLTAIAAGNPEP